MQASAECPGLRRQGNICHRNVRLSALQMLRMKCAALTSFACECALQCDALGVAVQAARECYAIRDIGPHRIAFLSCTRYNYCNLV